MSDDEKNAMKEQLDRIERCLIGDEPMGQFGLVSRVNNHASRIKRLERWSVYLLGACAALLAVYRIYVDLWPHK